MLKNTDSSYGSIAKFLHWFMAILIIAMLGFGYFLEDLKNPLLYKIHKALGLFILILAIIRLLWRLTNSTPSYDTSFPKILSYLAHLGHYTLYFLMFVMPLSAFIASNAAQKPVSFMFLFDLPSFFNHKNHELASNLMKIHECLAVIFIAVIIIHFIAALYHHLVRKDNVLLRMLPNLCQHKQ